MKFITTDRVTLTYELPLGEVVTDFFDQLKSRSKGYASMEYSLIGFRENKLVKLEVKINGDAVDPLSTIVHQDKAYYVGRALVDRLKELIPRQQFKIPIQACIGAKVCFLRSYVVSYCFLLFIKSLSNMFLHGCPTADFEYFSVCNAQGCACQVLWRRR